MQRTLKPFQPKRTLFFDEGEQQAFLVCPSAIVAELTLSLARMSQNPKYTPPPDGYDADALELARRMQGKKIIKDKSLYYMNSYYLRSRN